VLGCKHNNSRLVGTWVQLPDPAFSNPPDVTLTFEDNGTFKAKVSAPQGSITQGGTYETKGNSVTLHCSSYDMDAPDPVTQARVDKEKDQILNMTKNPVHRTVTWTSPTEFTMDGMPGPLMLGDKYKKK